MTQPDETTKPEPRPSAWARLGAFFRRRIVAGFVFIIPFVLTVWLVVWFFRFADGILGRSVNALLMRYGAIDYPIPTLGIGLLVMLLLGVGFVATSRIGQKLTAPIERGLLSVPVVKSIYGGTKQILQAFVLTGQGGAFQKVCLVQYPRKGLFALGFVTGKISKPLHTPSGDYHELFTVFVPTTPNPTSGFLILSPVEETYLLDLTVEEGVKIILSGGFVQADLDLITSSHIMTGEPAPAPDKVASNS